jgi:hypothetical protein
MTLSDLASLGSFVSGIAVLASLIYLAIQVRHSDRNQRGAIHQARLDVRFRYVDMLAGHPSPELMNRGWRGDPTLTALEVDQFVFAVGSDLLLYEEWFYQFHDGMIDNARWESSVRALSWEAGHPGWRAAWLSFRPIFGQDFASWVDGILETTPISTEASIAPRWHELAAQERAKATAD